MSDNDQRPDPHPPNGDWRILAHVSDGKIEITNQGELDEVVIGQWFHLERLDDNEWWLRVGDARILVSIGKQGEADVDIERGFYSDFQGRDNTDEGQ
jgi:hypothetical protein